MVIFSIYIIARFDMTLENGNIGEFDPESSILFLGSGFSLG